jgi:hypothetical protein
MAAMAVLKRISSVSSETFLMQVWRSLSCSLVGSSLVSEGGASAWPAISLYTLARKRWTPSTPLEFHTFVSRSGPMNIS